MVCVRDGLLRGCVRVSGVKSKHNSKSGCTDSTSLLN